MRGPRLAPSQLCPGHTAPAPQHWDTGAIFIFLTFCLTLSSASDHRIRTKSLRVQWCSSAVTLFSVAGHYFPLHQRCRAERGTAASACSMLQLHAIAIWRPGQQRSGRTQERRDQIYVQHFAFFITLHSKHRQTWLTCLLGAPHSRPGGAGGRV